MRQPRARQPGHPADFHHLLTELWAQDPAHCGRAKVPPAHQVHHAKTELALAHYEMHGWRGWHHHRALVALAQLVTVKERWFGFRWSAFGFGRSSQTRGKVRSARPAVRRESSFDKSAADFHLASMSPSADVRDFLALLAEPFTGEELFDAVTDLVYFLKDAACRYRVVNQALVERCGFRDKRDLIGRRADEVYPTPLGRSYREQDEAVIRTGRPILNHLELQIYASGVRGWCVTSKVPLRGASGAIAGLVGISKDLHAPTAAGGDYPSLATVIHHIQEHFNEPLKLSALARMAGLSAYQFEQRMRRIFAITAGQFIHKVRMDAAVRHLRETDQPIAAIAHACGYAEQSSFTRQFKQTVGLSPARYRRMSRGK